MAVYKLNHFVYIQGSCIPNLMEIYQIVPEKNPKFDGNLPNNSGEENAEESMMLLKKIAKCI